MPDILSEESADGLGPVDCLIPRSPTRCRWPIRLGPCPAPAVPAYSYLMRYRTNATSAFSVLAVQRHLGPRRWNGRGQSVILRA